jgi:MAE_28990/MAE_18760-like HEPN
MEIEALERKLDKQLGWRKKELLSVRANAQIALGPQQAVLLRCLTFLSYAHWEGFVKEAAVIYFDFIISQKRSYQELDESLLSIAIAKRANSGTQKPGYYDDVAKFLRYEQHTVAHMSPPSALSEMGMLTSERLTTILYCLSIQKNQFELKFNWIDYSLIPFRNRIAHGEYTSITPADVQEYFDICDDALSLLEVFRDQIVASANGKTYSRSIAEVVEGERL